MIQSLRFSRSSLIFTILIFMVLAGSVLIRANVARKHAFPEGDEGPWLRMAARAFTSEFLTSTVIEHDLYEKRELPHPEDNRSPLFPVLLRAGSIFSSNLFSAAQIINIILFVVCGAAATFCMLRRFDKASVLLFILFIGVSPIFIINTAHIYNDVTMAFGFFLVVLAAPAAPSSRLHAAGMGVVVGLLFLMKISAIFLLTPLGFYFFLRGFHKENILRAVIFLISFLLLAAPWMIRNQILFGSPSYQFTGSTMWIDSMKEIFSVNIPRPSLTSYLAVHGPLFTFVIRPLVGFKNLLLQILTHDHRLTQLLLPFFIFGGWQLRRSKQFWIPLLVFSAPYLGLMSQVAYGFWVDRYLLVYYLLIYLVAAKGIVATAGLVNIAPLRYGILVLLTAIPLSAVAFPIEYYLSGRGSEHSIDAAARSIINDIQPLVPDSTAVLSSFLGLYAFLHDMHVVNTIEISSPEDLQILVDAYSIRYALLDSKDTTMFNLLVTLVGRERVGCLRRNEAFSFYEIRD